MSYQIEKYQSYCRGVISFLGKVKQHERAGYMFEQKAFVPK